MQGPPSQRKNRGTSVSQNHGFFTIYRCVTKVWLFSVTCFYGNILVFSKNSERNFSGVFELILGQLATDEPTWCVVWLETASFAPWFESVG